MDKLLNQFKQKECWCHKNTEKCGYFDYEEKNLCSGETAFLKYISARNITEFSVLIIIGKMQL